MTVEEQAGRSTKFLQQRILLVLLGGINIPLGPDIILFKLPILIYQRTIGFPLRGLKVIIWARDTLLLEWWSIVAYHIRRVVIVIHWLVQIWDCSAVFLRIMVAITACLTTI